MMSSPNDDAISEHVTPSERAHHPQREVAFHLTLSEEDRELLDTLAARMNCSRIETIARALHLLQAVQEEPRDDVRPREAQR